MILRPVINNKKCFIARIFLMWVCALGSALTELSAEPLPAASPELTSAAAQADDSRGIRVVVTANRGLAESDLDVPQMVSVVDRDTLDERAFNDVNEAIKAEPSVSLAPAGVASGYWNPGFTVRGLGAQRVLTLTDGIRQAGQGIGYGGGSLSLYDPIMIERVEVLRGPRSVIYGTDAIGGIVNIQTRQPSQRSAFGMGGALRAEFDEGFNYDRYAGYIDFGDTNYAFIGGLYTKDAGRPRVPGERPDEGSYQQRGAWAQLDYYLSDLWTVKVLGNTVQNRDVLIADDSIRLPQLDFSIPGPPSIRTVEAPLFFEFPEYNRSLFGSQLVKEDPGALLEYLMAGIYWQQVQREFRRESLFFSNPAAGPASPLETDIVNTNDEVNTYEFQLLTRWTPHEAHLLTLGLDLGYDHSDLPVESTRTVVSNPLPGPPFTGTETFTSRKRAEAQQFRAGVYLQDQWTLGDWELTGGLRLDHFEVNDDISDYQADETGLSGSIAALYRYDEATAYYASISSGFRVPDLGERFQDAVVNIGGPSRVIGDPDLEPERSWNLELGTKRENERFSYEAAIFYNYVKNFINDNRDLGTVDGFDTTQFQNAGDVALYGIELAAGYQLNANWNVFGNIARTDTDDDTLVAVRGWTLNYGITYRQESPFAWLETLSSTLRLRTVSGSKDTLDDENFGGFTVAEWQINLDLAEHTHGQTRVIAGIRNLTDKSYEEPFFNSEQPERSAFVSVEYRF
jgi:hemoglobin/transferrin/lactoferrin receptor protein